jgi:solute carrier family 45 protein 1/2/4
MTMEKGGPSKAAAEPTRLVSLEIEDGVAHVKDGSQAVEPTSNKKSLLRMFLACMVSGGIQYGWALQLSLLSPYAQVSSTILSLGDMDVHLNLRTDARLFILRL